MPNPILIEFKTDVSQVDTAIDKLEQLGFVDKQVADEYRKASTQIKEHNKNLQKTGKDVDEVTLSVNDMVKAMKSVPSKIVDDAAKKTVQELGKEFGVVTDKTAKLTTQLRVMKDELSQMEAAGLKNTNRYKEMAAQAGALEDQIGDTTARVKILASDTKNLDAALSLATGVAGGFAVAQGAAALFGDENEELQKQLLKVQAALSIVNGLQAIAATVNKDSAASVVLLGGAQKAYNSYIGASTGLMKAFKIAAAGIGVGLVAFAIFEGVKALTSYIDKLEKAKYTIGQTIVTQEEYIGVQNAATEATAGISAELNALLTIARDETKTRQQQNDALAKINEKYGDYLGNLTQENKNSAEINQKIKEYIELMGLKAKSQALFNLIVEREQKFLENRETQKAELQAEINLRQKRADRINDESVATAVYAENLGKLAAFETAAEKKTKKHEQAMQGLNDEYASVILQLNELEGKFKKTGDTGVSSTKEITDEVEKLRETTSAEPISLIEGPDQLGEKLEANIKLHEDYVERLKELEAQIKDATLADLGEIKAKRKEVFFDIVATAQQTADLLSQFNQQQMDKELAQLDQQLANKQISQEQYDAAVKSSKREAAKDNKKIAVFETIINTASAVVEALPKIPLAIIAGIIGAAQLALIISQPLPLAKGTRRITGGEANKDSVHALLMPGEGVMPKDVNEAYDPILTKIYKKQIPAPFLNALANMSMPDFTSMMDMMHSGMAVPVMQGIDYDLMAEKFGEKISSLPISETYFDEDGFHRSVRTKTTHTEYLDKRYRRD